MPLEIIRNDITKIKVDAIVNSTDNQLNRGKGVCGAIFKAAGERRLEKACEKIGECEIGDAVITKAYNISAKYIIHTVGPNWNKESEENAKFLYNSYMNSLELAKKHNCKSVAFPLISSRFHGAPKNIALNIATSAISDFLLQNDMMVYLVVFDNSSFTISEKLFKDIKEYISDNYVEKHIISRKQMSSSQAMDFKSKHSLELAGSQAIAAPLKETSLDELISKMEETFSQSLFRIIDEKGLNDSQVYKKANIDRRLFSKIRCNDDYKPSKNTAIALCIALELGLDETKDLLKKSGYALSKSNKMDVIVEYFIHNKKYNIFEINEALFAFDQSLLGA